MGNRKETAEIISNTRGSNDGKIYHASVGTNVEKYLFEELKCHVDSLFGKGNVSNDKTDVLSVDTEIW